MRKGFIHCFCSFFSLILVCLLEETLRKAQVGAARPPAALQRGVGMGSQVGWIWVSKWGGEVDMSF